jgi:hypothetical protein
MAISSPPQEITKNISYFKGLKISVNNTQIDDESSPDMLNLLPDDRGALDKRKGRINLFASLGNGATYMFIYRKNTGDIYVFSHADKFYKVTDLATGTYSLIYTGLSGNRVRGFNYNNLFFFLDGTKYFQFDGTNVTEVVGYVPTVTIATPPAGGGTLFESLNYIQPGFKQSFSGDGTATNYQLALLGLDATLVTATVNGVAKAETTDFTVNRTTGVVTFSAAPASGTDNVVITAYKTFAGNKDEIFKCTICYIWGGAEGNRVWLSGNPNYKNRDYGSGLQDPTYFPVDQFDNVGNDDDPIKGYSELYGLLLIIKRRSVFTRDYLIEEGDPTFPTKRLNSDIGAESTDSIQILDNYPTFVSRKGVYQIVSIDQENEMNVRHISDDIDKNVNVLSVQGFLDMGNLSTYTSIDYDNKYWLFNPSNGIVWVYDYRYLIAGIGQWFKLNNLYATTPMEIEDTLYLADSRKGMIHRIMDDNDPYPYSDTEGDVSTAIQAYWVSKIFNFDTITNLKLVSKIFFTLKPGKRASANLYTRSDLRSVWSFIKTAYVGLFVYRLASYSTFTYGGSEFPRASVEKVKAKKIGYYQLKLENNHEGETLGILNVAFKLLYQREAK